MRFFKNPNINFLKYRKLFVSLSITLIIACIIITLLEGIEYGIDFAGGTEVAVSVSNPLPTDKIRSVVTKSGLTGVEIKSFGEENQFLIRTMESTNAPELISNSLTKAFPNEKVTIMKVDKIGPKIGSELRAQAFWAVLLAVIVMLIYLAFRFEFIFGLGAIVALVHDVILTFTIAVTLNNLGIFNLEVNLSILAAMLTVVGYSVNDTVIIFDRIRENKERHKGMNFIKLANLSINETLSRTVNTVATTLLALLSLFIFGGPVLQGFAFIMIIGIILGTYSSVYIASAFVIWYLERIKKIDLESGFREVIGAKSE
ncbi:MAG: protein translocase subunit SecF [Ignavibacteria bacterium]|nr:protein translocase subunit SecF [Ignavibacteria bacterium]